MKTNSEPGRLSRYPALTENEQHDEVNLAADGSACTTNSAQTQAAIRDVQDPRVEPTESQASIHPRAVRTEQATILADLALTVLQTPRGITAAKTAAMATILSGRMNDLEPEAFRQTMAILVKCVSGSSLDVIGGLFGLTRGTTIHNHGQFRDRDASPPDGLLHKLEASAPPSAADWLVGVSLRTALHFDPQATFAQQESAVGKAVQAVKDEIVRTEVDGILRINNLWWVVRFACPDLVIDVGGPNLPFEEILLWRHGKPEPLIGNYTVEPGQRLIIEPSLAAAIDIRPAGGRAF